ncbi:hypothetical protein ACWEN4_19480 [Streptomyces violaceorubidus]
MAVITTAVLNRPACPVTTTPPGRHPLTNAAGTTLAPGNFAVGCRPVRRRNENEAPEAQTLRSAETSTPDLELSAPAHDPHSLKGTADE